MADSTGRKRRRAAAGGASASSQLGDSGSSHAASSALPESAAHGRRRFRWTPELHRRFTAAVFDIGLKACTPKSLLAALAAYQEDITTDHIKSHLQKYRANSKTSRAEFLADYDRAMLEAHAKAEVALAEGRAAFPPQYSTYPITMPPDRQHANPLPPDSALRTAVPASIFEESEGSLRSQSSGTQRPAGPADPALRPVPLIHSTQHAPMPRDLYTASPDIAPRPSMASAGGRPPVPGLVRCPPAASSSAAPGMPVPVYVAGTARAVPVLADQSLQSMLEPLNAAQHARGILQNANLQGLNAMSQQPSSGVEFAKQLAQHMESNMSLHRQLVSQHSQNVHKYGASVSHGSGPGAAPAASAAQCARDLVAAEWGAGAPAGAPGVEAAPGPAMPARTGAMPGQPLPAPQWAGHTLSFDGSDSVAPGSLLDLRASASDAGSQGPPGSLDWMHGTPTMQPRSPASSAGRGSVGSTHFMAMPPQPGQAASPRAVFQFMTV